MPMTKSLKNSYRSHTLALVLSVLFVLIVGTIFVGSIIAPHSANIADAVRQKANALQISSQIKDQHGRDLGAFSDQSRYVVSIQDVPSRLQKAFIAAEDDTFWKHRGVSVRGMLRAAAANLKHDRFAQGGSTITQQLVRQLLLPREKTIFRKLREIVLAIALERQMNKREILELWLNSVYLGNNAWGVEAAARHYFNKHVKDLNLAESAMLAGLPQAPSLYAPHVRPKLARKRQLYVLSRMLKMGWLTKKSYEVASKSRVRIEPRREVVVERAPWVTEMARVELWRRLEQKNLPSSGLVINTTINKAWQMDLQSGVETVFRDIAKDGLEVAIVVLETQSGAIRAIVGGSDFKQSQFNRAVDLERPFGASVYPLIFLWGMERGILNITGYSSIAEAAVKSRFAEAELLAPEIGYGFVRERLSTVGLKIDDAVAIDEICGSPLNLARAYLGIAGSEREGAPLTGLIASVFADRKALYNYSAEPSAKLTAENMAYVTRQWMALGSRSDSQFLAGQPLMKSVKGWNAWWVIPRTDVVIAAWIGAERSEPKNPESLKQSDQSMDQLLSGWLNRNVKPSSLGRTPEGISYHISPGPLGPQMIRLPIVVPGSMTF